MSKVVVDFTKKVGLDFKTFKIRICFFKTENCTSNIFFTLKIHTENVKGS